MSSNTESTVILCATARLTRSLQLAQQQQQINSGARQWQPSHITTLSNWLESTIEPALLLGEIDVDQVPTSALSTTQEGLLWEQSIQHVLKSSDVKDLFDTSGLASAAMEANRFLTEWHLNIDIENATEETRQFMQWRAHFQDLCKQVNVLEAVRYEVWQLNCLNKGAGTLPLTVQLAGFDRIHPNTQRLINILKMRGATVSDYPITLPAISHIEHVLLNDQDAECRTAVAWAKTLLAKNSQARLAIIVPELKVLRAKLSYLLDDTFHPQAAAPAQAEITRCYDFTLGVALSTLPIIATAIDLLRLAWSRQPVLQTDIARLLHNAYWSASQQENDARAKLDACMRRDLPLSFKTNRLMRFIHRATEGEYALPLQRLLADAQQLMQLSQAHTRKQTPSAWAATFTTLLAATHWQGDRSLSSHEYQAVQSFERVLLQLTSLENLLGKISAQEAIKRLTQLCQAQIFQPERKTQAAIQVMGMLEAAAEPLDAVWVIGMNDHVWPPVARPNALISAELQRSAGTPNASSEVQSGFAQAIHQRLTKSAKHVIFSSAEKDGERQLRISPLMHDIQSMQAAPATVNTLAETLALAATQDWQWLDDHQAPPVLSGEHIAGGTALLKAQAICPAWAFYQYRLSARQLDEPSNGLDAMQRGTLVHKVLAQYWLGRSSEDLKNSTPENLKNTLHTIAQAVLTAFNKESENAFSDAFLSLETERLSKLVLAWLVDVEMLRPLAFSVKACEEEHSIQIEGISIKLVIDRVDALADGCLLVMDYKTSSQMDFKNWAHPNITEPQLPIYAAFLLQDSQNSEETPTVSAVCYAKVRIAEHGFVGVAASEETVQGATVFDTKQGRKIFNETDFPGWKNIISHWKNRITTTAISLKSGDAGVCFDNEKHLDYCEVIPLLRLPERQLQFEHLRIKPHSR